MNKICKRKTWVHMYSDENELLASSKCSGDILGRNLEASLIPNIHYMKELGVSQSYINRVLRTYPNSVILNHYEFGMIVDDVKEVDSNPKNFMFLYYIQYCVNEQSSMGKEDAFDLVDGLPIKLLYFLWFD